jgi:hypothetical protein
VGGRRGCPVEWKIVGASSGSHRYVIHVFRYAMSELEKGLPEEFAKTVIGVQVRIIRTLTISHVGFSFFFRLVA